MKLSDLGAWLAASSVAPGGGLSDVAAGLGELVNVAVLVFVVVVFLVLIVLGLLALGAVLSLSAEVRALWE